MIITGSPTNDNASIQEVEVRSGALSTTSPYLDLGQIITATNMAAGAIVYSNLLTNVQWVRNIIFATQTDQQYDLQIWFYDSYGNALGAAGPVTSIAGPGASSWSMKQITLPQSLLGVSVKFAIKNSSASPNTVANLKVQLMGA